MKSERGSHKAKRERVKGEMTGAPPAKFLSCLKLDSMYPLIRESRPAHHDLTTDEITKRVWSDLMELAERVILPRCTNEGIEESASSLATVAVVAAELLEYLSATEKPSIRLAAWERVSWPVLLRLGHKRTNQGERCLEGADKARAYLNDIWLDKGAATIPVLKHFGDREANIFKRAAELLLHSLVRFREHGAWRETVTPWVEDLMVLHWPMTSENVEKWWSVAKRWMDEQWEANRALFLPLIENCRHKKEKQPTKTLADPNVGLFDSEIKSRVIDLRLKEAFFALARPADL